MGEQSRFRARTEVRGIVQGVGFRPFIHGLAHRFLLGGFVKNTSDGALLEVEGSEEALGDFLQALNNEAPPLARITGLHTSRISPQGDTVFHISHSQAQSTRTALISPDAAVCDDCLREMFDPADRRYRYPFINCTNCGPRYTIITDIPYDRDKTSMRVFKMCPDCQKEYDDPRDRRFHAQPNACPVCGPMVRLLDDEGQEIDTDDPIRTGAEILKNGLVLAVKGLGGFHLAVDALNNEAVRRLRSRKRREEKPLAVMPPDMTTARMLARIDQDEERILTSTERPIVLLNKASEPLLAPETAPDNKYVGILLPYTPLHHLLLQDFTALVMTSGNLTEEPICIDNEEALSRLDGIADYYLVHNRDIHLRSDDSVVRSGPNGPRQMRRSRGFVPVPVFLKENLPSVLAVGGELKNTICLTKDNRAFISQHIGDLENLRTLEFFELTINHLQRILDIEPTALAYDLHPEYLSTKWALDQSDRELIGVQHHHAHVAGTMAEHGLEGPVIGLSCDGTGYGEDGRIWGGEILVADYVGYERKGHLDYVPLPGGAAAIKEPWRMAVSYLDYAFGSETSGLDLDLLARQDPDQLDLLRQVIAKRIASPLTSSLGRLFDAAAAMVGLRDRAAFEGQAAMMLEMCCPDGEFKPYDVDLSEENDRYIIKLQAFIRQLTSDVMSGRPQDEISGRFHWGVIEALAEATRKIAAETGITTVVMSGGCFQNQILTQGLFRKLESGGLQVYTQELAPVNDGGLSLGQAVIAGHRCSQ